MNPSKVYGLIGYPTKHSLSPVMHNAAFRACNINAEYRLFEVKPEELEDFLLNPHKEIRDIEGKSVIRAGDIIGFNITIPHKVRAKDILEKEFPLKETSLVQEDLYYVKLSGAINTVKRVDNELRYWNTDAFGFLRSLKEDLGFNTQSKNILIIGCGGAGRVIFASLGWVNMQVKKIYIYEVDDRVVSCASQHFSKISYLNGKWEFISLKQIPEFIKNCHLLVNATPVGMKEGDGSVIDKKLLHKGLCVYDVVYNRDTQLIKDAKEMGLKATGGLGMLLYQGARAFELWTGKTAPIKIMRQALEQAIKKI
jgi:shikimate dehydrogenase